jgi:hypothetical protein
MASAYPGALDALDITIADADTTATHHPQHHIDLADAVNKIEAELGVNPSASFADVATRLNGMITVRKTADQTMTGTALVNVTDLVFPIPAAAGAMYTYQWTIMWTTTTATSGIGVAMTFPTLGTGGYNSANVNIAALAADGAAANFHGVITGASGADTVLSTAAVATGTVYTAIVTGTLYAGSTANTAGNLQLQCRSEATAGGTVVKIGSHGVLWTG